VRIAVAYLAARLLDGIIVFERLSDIRRDNCPENNREDFEKRFGLVRHRAVQDRQWGGARGDKQEIEYWLTKGQVLWVCRKSDARNADDVMEEVIKVFLAVDAGAPIPDTPWTDSLFAPFWSAPAKGGWVE
jgi:hypothetical protein